MAALLRLLFLAPLGFIAAVVAAVATILVGSYGQEPGILTNMAATGFAIGVAFVLMMHIGAVAFIPVFIVIVLAEMFRWRSVFLYLAVGGAIGLVPSAVSNVVGVTPDGQHLLLAAGFVGGFVYWLVAGRLAGFQRAPEPPDPPVVSPPAGPPSG